MNPTTAGAHAAQALLASDGVAAPRGGRPTNFVAAALADRASSERAIAELVEAGVPEDGIAVLQGEIGAAVIAAGRSARAAIDLAGEDRYVSRFEDEARAGHFVIGVPVANRRVREQARAILARHGAHAVVSRSRWTHEIEP